MVVGYLGQWPRSGFCLHNQASTEWPATKIAGRYHNSSSQRKVGHTKHYLNSILREGIVTQTPQTGYQSVVLRTDGVTENWCLWFLSTPYLERLCSAKYWLNRPLFVGIRAVHQIHYLCLFVRGSRVHANLAAGAGPHSKRGSSRIGCNSTYMRVLKRCQPHEVSLGV